MMTVLVLLGYVGVVCLWFLLGVGLAMNTPHPIAAGVGSALGASWLYGLFIAVVYALGTRFEKGKA